MCFEALLAACVCTCRTIMCVDFLIRLWVLDGAGSPISPAFNFYYVVPGFTFVSIKRGSLLI